MHTHTPFTFGRPPAPPLASRRGLATAQVIAHMPDDSTKAALSSALHIAAWKNTGKELCI